MSARPCGLLFGALLAAGIASAVAAREAAPPPAEPPLMPPAGKKIDPLQLPVGSSVVLKPEEYQALLDELARLKGKLRTPPARCRLRGGRVEDGTVLLNAEFDLHAERPDAVFTLACGQAKARAAQQQDGRTPMLSSDADGGYLVQVDKPGDYTVTLELALPLGQRPAGQRGFELDLPRAAVTMLEMALPAGARSPHVNGKDLGDTVLTFENGQLAGPLGPADKLDLSWQPAAAAGAGPLQTAHTRVTVRVAEDYMAVQAELTLHAQGAPVRSWAVAVPAGYEVKPAAVDQPRVQIDRQEAAGVVHFTVRLKGQGDDDVTLIASSRTWLGDGKWKAVGPFQVPGAVRHSGEVLVSGGPDARLNVRPHEDLTPRDAADERPADPTVTAAYDFAAAPSDLPWLEVQSPAAHGAVTTQEAYTLAMVRPAGGAPEWQVTANVTATPSAGAGVDHVALRLPPGCEPLPGPAGPAAVVRQVEVDKDDPHLLHIRLNGAPAGAVTFAVKARYTSDDLAAGAAKKDAAFPLPRPVAKIDSCTQIEADVPEDVELAPPADADVKEPHRVVWRSAPAADRPVVLSWQPFRPEVRVESVIDLTLRGGAAEVQQEMRLHFPRTPPKQITLRTPPAVAAALQVLAGGTLAEDAAAPDTRTLRLAGTGSDQSVTLKYAFALAPAPGGAGDAFPVPLPLVEQAKEGGARVRVWCGPGRLPLPPGGDWLEKDIEEVKDRNRLPVLVLESSRPDAPLALAFGAPAGAQGVLVDRTLVRATLDGDMWDVRASYLLRQPADAPLDVELPDSAAALRLRAALDGKEAEPDFLDQAGADGRVRHVARLRLGGDFFHKPARLDLAYRLPARGALDYTLAPPLLAGDPGRGPARWAVTLPSDAFVVLGPEDGGLTRRTVGLWRGWLPAPEIAATDDDLERWFAGADLPPGASAAGAAPSLVAWQDAGRPLTVTFVPDGVWLLACSLPLVVLGYLLYGLARRSYAGGRWASALLWVLIVVLIGASAAAWVFRPTLLYAVAFGCEPGAAVLLVFLLGHAVLLERHRRRIVFLPNFRRARTGSSLVQAGGLNRPSGEPSTVDAPRVAGSSSQQPL